MIFQSQANSCKKLQKMLKKSMIIKLHIQIANKQLNVYNNTIITLMLSGDCKKAENRFSVALRLTILKK